MTKLFRKMAVIIAWVGLLLSPMYSRAEDSDSSLLSGWDLACNYVGVALSSGEIAFYDTLSGDVKTSSTSTEFNNEPATDPSKTSLKDAVVTLSDTALYYSGEEQGPAVTVTLNDTTLTQGTDYTLSGNVGTDAGLYVLSVSGAGDYSGTWDAGWSITSKVVTATAKSYTVSLGETAPTYEVEYEGFANGETASVLTTAPVLACDYTTTAEEGASFDITFATEPAAKNYTFVCVPGMITVSSVYTITMNAGEGGTGGGSVEGGYQFKANDAQSFVLPTPTRTGYHISESQTQVNVDGVTFKYHAASEGQGLYYTVEIPAGTRGNIEITPVWDANYYKIVYNNNATNTSNGVIITLGTVANQERCLYDQDVTLAQNGFTREGYAFKGWTQAKNGSGTLYTAGETLTKPNFSSDNNGTVTLYAQWERMGYELGYDNLFSLADFAAKAGSMKIISSGNGTVEAHVGDGTITINHNNTGSDARTPLPDNTGSWSSYYGMSLQSGVEYEISFDITKTSDQTKWGLTVLDYALEKTEIKNQTVSGHQSLRFTPTSSGGNVLITFWNSTKSSSVTFSNIRVVKAERAEQAAKSESVRKLVTKNAAVGELEEPTWTGYAFLGWNTAEDGTGTTFNETSTITASTPLFSQWAERTAVCYATVNGSTNNTTMIALGAACPTLGYMYVGSVEGEDPADFVTTAPAIACDYTTLSPVGTYAVTPSGAVSTEYTITYQPTSFEVIYGETKYSIKLEGQKVASYTAKDTDQDFDLSSYVPTREGYEISGWNIEGGNLTKGGVVAFTSGSLAVPGGCYGAITLSVTDWTQSSPIVVFHLNDGSDTTAEQAFAAGETKALKTLTELGFSRTNYRFKGWATSATSKTIVANDGESVTPFATGAESTATLDYYAIWDVIPMAFYFDPNGGSLDDNARIVLKGNPLSHNVNIYPSDASDVSYYNAFVKSGSHSFADGVLSLDMVMKVSSSSGLYFCFRPKPFDLLSLPPPTLRYSGIYEVLSVDPEKASVSSIKFAESNSKKGNTQIYSSPETIVQGEITQCTKVVSCLTHNPNSGKYDYLMNTVFTQPKTDTKTEQALKCDIRFSLYAGRAPEVAACFQGDDPELHTYKRHFDYIECALPTPTWTGMRFVEWNTAADGSGRAVSAESLADGQQLGREGELTTLYAIWEPDGTYYWNKSIGGAWDPSAAGEVDNWYARSAGYVGFPNAAGADTYFLNNPLFGFASAGAPITVASAADVTMGSLTFGPNTQPVTLDMGGHTLVATTDGVTTNAELSISSAVTFSNGDYSFGPARLPGTSSDVIVDQGVNLTIHTHTNNHYAWGRSNDTAGDQKLTIREGATLRFVNDDSGTALNESHCYGLTTINGGTFDIDSPKGSKLFFDGGLIADHAKIVLPYGSTEACSIRFEGNSSVPYQVNNSDIDAAYVYVAALSKTVGLTNSVLHKGSNNLTYLYVTVSDSNIFAENTDLSILRIKEDKSNINVEATQGSSIRIYMESGAFENTIYAVDSEVQRLWLSTNKLGKVLLHDNSFVFSNCTLVAENTFWVRGTNNIVRIEGSTAGETINFKFDQGAKLVFSLPEDAADREAPIYVKKSSGNQMDVNETIVIEKGDYVIELGAHKYLPLIRLDNDDTSALLTTLGEATQIATLTENAEVDEAFGTRGTDWRFVVVGRTLCLELNPPDETDQIYSLAFGEIEDVATPGTLSQTTYAHNYAAQTVTITPPTFVESTDQITGWTIENDLDETLMIGFNSSEQPKVGAKNGDGTYTLTIPARLAGNLTITPIVTSKKCVFTFSANCTTYTGTMAKQTLKYNEGNRLNLNAFTRLGYAFAGWNTVKGGTGIQFSDNQEITSIEGDPSKLTLYAQWRPTAFGLGYENLFILSDFVKSDGPFRAYSTSAENSSQGTISADLTAGSLTLENKVDSTSDEVHTARATKKSQMPDYYLMPITYQYYTVRFSVTGANANASVDGAQFAVDAMVGTSGLGTRLDVGAVTNSVDGTYSFNLRAKSSASVWLQIRFFTFGKGASYTFSDIRVYPTAKEEVVNSLSDAATAWGQTFADTATAYVTPLPTPTRAGFTFVGWNTKPDGSGVWSDDAAFVPDATSHTLYSQWTVAKPTVTTESFVYDLLEHTGVVGMPTLDVAKVTNGTAKNAGTYTAIATLLDPSVAWEDGSAHGSKDDVELVWSIAPKPLSVGKNNTTFNDEGFNRPNQLWQNRLYDGRNVTVKPSAYKYKGSTSTAVTLVEGVDYTVTFKDADGNVIDNPTTNMPIQGDYLTILTGIGNFTGYTQNTWSVSRPIYVWEGDASDKWAENGSWSIKNDGYTIDYFNNKWPNSRNQSAKMEEESVIDLTNDDTVYCYQFYTDGDFTATIKNGTLYHYNSVRALSKSTLVFENMTIQGNSGTGCRVYPYGEGSSLMFVGTNSLTGAANLQYGTTVSNSTLAFVNGYTEALPTVGDKNIICKSAMNEYTLVRNFVMTNAMLKAIEMDPGTEYVMTMNPVRFEFQFTLGELNTTTTPMAEFTDTLRIPSGSTMSIDCSGMDAGEYPIMKAAKFFDNANIVEHTQIVGVGYGLVAQLIKKGSFGGKTGQIILQLARAYRALGDDDTTTPAIGIPDSWITDFGRTPSSDPVVAEKTMDMLNTKNGFGVSPIEAYMMGFNGNEVQDVRLVVQSKAVTNNGITLTLGNGGQTEWPEALESESMKVRYILESADTPNADTWGEVGESQSDPNFEIVNSSESQDEIKYYRIKCQCEVNGKPLK